MTEFTAHGSPRAVSTAIEQCAVAHGSVSALVVPWESDRMTLTMAVTAVAADGWAIEHTNLGTIILTDAGNESTRVAITAAELDRPEKHALASLFDRFVRHVQGDLTRAS